MKDLHRPASLTDPDEAPGPDPADDSLPIEALAFIAALIAEPQVGAAAPGAEVWLLAPDGTVLHDPAGPEAAGGAFADRWPWELEPLISGALADAASGGTVSFDAFRRSTGQGGDRWMRVTLTLLGQRGIARLIRADLVDVSAEIDAARIKARTAQAARRLN